MGKKNSSPTYSLQPPSNAVCGMTILDRDKFQCEFEVPYLLIPKEKLKAVQEVLKPHFLKMRMFHPIRSEGNNRKVILNPENFEIYRESLKKLTLELHLDDVMWTKMQFTYNNWAAEDIIKSVLPSGSMVSFTNLGSIILLNLTSEQLNYKFLIGQVLLDKYQQVKTVINQLFNNICREFKMELLAGAPNFQVLVKQNRFQYEIDLAKIYYNPLIISESEKIVNYVNPGDIVYDVFAGVGLFSIPLAERECEVHANDPSPEYCHWLRHNIKLNKIEKNLMVYNRDENAFIEEVVKKGLIEHFSCNKKKVRNVHIIMDLCCVTLQYLHCFNGLLSGENNDDSSRLPVAHCYFLIKRENENQTDMLNNFVHEDSMRNATVTTIGAVASNKLMMYVRYKIAKKVLFSDLYSILEPSPKRMRVDSRNYNETIITNIKTEPVSEIETEPVSEIKTEPVSEVESEPISKIKTEPVSKIESEPISEIKTEPVSETETEPVSEIETEPVSEVESEPISKIKTEPVSKIESEPISEIKTEPVSETENEPVSEMETELISEIKTEPVSATETEPVSEAETEPASETETEPVFETETEFASLIKTEPVSEIETEPASEAETEPACETETELPYLIKTELVSEIETEPVSEIKTELDM